MYPVELQGEWVRLQEFSLDDLDAALEVVSDDQVTRSLSFDSRDRDQTLDMLTGVVERARATPREEYYLAVMSRDANRLVGFARLGLGGVHAGKLGGAIRADEWGKGYAIDAARAIIDFGFRELDLHRISAAIGPHNDASIALVKKLGFQYEGRLRDHVFTNGAWRDSLLYSIIVR